jgi:hypothetical protein
VLWRHADALTKSTRVEVHEIGSNDARGSRLLSAACRSSGLVAAPTLRRKATFQADNLRSPGHYFQV